MSDDKPNRTWREVFITSLLHGAPAGFLTWATPRLAAAAKEVDVPAGQTLYRAGDPADTGYFVVSGALRLDKPGASSRTLGARSIVGLLDAFLERPRSHDAVAVGQTRLLAIAASEWFDVMEDSFDTAMFFVSSLATSLVASPRALEHELPSTDDEMPSSVTLIESVAALRRVPLLAGARAQTLVVLASQMQLVRLEEGEIVQVSTRDREIFVIVHGEMEVSTPPVGPRSFSSVSILGGAAAFATGVALEARATRRTLALSLTMEQWLDVMEDHFDLARSLIRAMVTEREANLNAAELPAETAALSLAAGSIDHA